MVSGSGVRHDQWRTVCVLLSVLVSMARERPMEDGSGEIIKLVYILNDMDLNFSSCTRYNGLDDYFAAIAVDSWD